MKWKFKRIEAKSILIFLLIAHSVSLAQLTDFFDVWKVNPSGFVPRYSWEAIGQDSKGNVYAGFGGSFSGAPEDVAIYKINTTTDQLSYLGSLRKTAQAQSNLQNNEAIPKGHASFAYLNGKMWIGTQGFHDITSANLGDLPNYRGAHIFSVDENTGIIDDATRHLPNGVIVPNQGLIDLQALPCRGLLIGLTHPYGDILIYEPKTSKVELIQGAREHAGQSIARNTLISPSGDVYWTYGYSNLKVYRMNIDEKIVRFAGELNTNGFLNGRTTTRDGSKTYSNSYSDLIEIDEVNKTLKIVTPLLPAARVEAGERANETWGISFSLDETKIYVQPTNTTKTTPNLELFEINLLTKEVQSVGTGIGAGAVTGSDVRDSQGRVYVNLHSYSNKPHGIQRWNVQDRTGPGPSVADNQCAENPLANGLLLHYDFENITNTHIIDKSGNGKNGLRQNGVGTTIGIKGNALVLDGIDDYVLASLQMKAPGTVSLWFRPDSLYNYNTIFDNSIDGNDWEMWIQGEKINESWYNCEYCWRFRMGGDATSRDLGRASTDIRPLGGAGKWYHALVTYAENGYTTLYINGIKLGEGTSTGHKIGGEFIYLGGGNSSNTAGKGLMDEFRVYNRVLSSSEIEALAQEFQTSLGGGQIPHSDTTLVTGVLEAEAADSLQDLTRRSTALGQSAVGSWAQWKNLKFEEQFSKVRLSYGVPATYAGNKLELRLGSPTGQLVASLVTQGSGGWEAYRTDEVNLASFFGVHDLYLVYANGSNALNNWVADVDKIVFVEGVTSILIYNSPKMHNQKPWEAMDWKGQRYRLNGEVLRQ
jgi:hypothetical protein